MKSWYMWVILGLLVVGEAFIILRQNSLLKEVSTFEDALNSKNVEQYKIIPFEAGIMRLNTYTGETWLFPLFLYREKEPVWRWIREPIGISKKRNEKRKK
ncbi:hypothetical protein KAW50_06350 [candidate division WOR-3 bacterium]|nr:hypothetical protein [candidate division WOR-3 bacterium]